MPFTPPTNHCQTKGFSIIGNIILERIDCFGNKVECGVGLSIALVRLNHHERSPKSLEGRNSHQSFFWKWSVTFWKQNAIRWYHNCKIEEMGKYRVPHFEFPASSSPIFEFPASENSDPLVNPSCPLIDPSCPLAENSATLCIPSSPLAHSSGPQRKTRRSCLIRVVR